MKYLKDMFKKVGWESIITSVIFVVLGLILITEPEGTLRLISTILGIIFIFVGLYKIWGYLKNKGNYNFYNYEMAYGIISIILGIIIMCYSSQISFIFRILIGLWIIYSSVIRIDLSWKLKTSNSKIWMYSMIIAVIMLVCGIFVICNSGAVVVAIGTIIIVYSVLDIIESIIFLVNLKNIE